MPLKEENQLHGGFEGLRGRGGGVSVAEHDMHVKDKRFCFLEKEGTRGIVSRSKGHASALRIMGQVLAFVVVYNRTRSSL